MRLFVAVELPDGIKDYLERVQGLIGKDQGISFVKKEQMHLTLKFLGEVQPEKADRIRAQLRMIKVKPFSMQLAPIGIFPDEEDIRVIWVGLKPEDKIISLQKGIDDSLKMLFEKEKDFKAHLTLGRVKHLNEKQGFINRLKSIKIESLNLDVDSFFLVKSTLTREGPVYESLERFNHT